MANCVAQVFGPEDSEARRLDLASVAWEAPGRRFERTPETSPRRVGDRPGGEGCIRWRGEHRQRREVGMSPACPGDGEEPGLGGGQVRKPERSVMKGW